MDNDQQAMEAAPAVSTVNLKYQSSSSSGDTNDHAISTGDVQGMEEAEACSVDDRAQMQEVERDEEGLHSKVVSCRVKGCCVDLVQLGKAYCLRKRVCPEHLSSKAVQLDSPDGDANWFRFCHQCGKFEPLELFDGTRRSCRATLLRRRAVQQQQRLLGKGGQKQRDFTSDTCSHDNDSEGDQEHQAMHRGCGRGRKHRQQDNDPEYAGPRLKKSKAITSVVTTRLAKQEQQQQKQEGTKEEDETEQQEAAEAAAAPTASDDLVLQAEPGTFMGLLASACDHSDDMAQPAAAATAAGPDANTTNGCSAIGGGCMQQGHAIDATARAATVADSPDEPVQLQLLLQQQQQRQQQQQQQVRQLQLQVQAMQQCAALKAVTAEDFELSMCPEDYIEAALLRELEAELALEHHWQLQQQRELVRDTSIESSCTCPPGLPHMVQQQAEQLQHHNLARGVGVGLPASCCSGGGSNRQQQPMHLARSSPVSPLAGQAGKSLPPWWQQKHPAASGAAAAPRNLIAMDKLELVNRVTEGFLADLESDTEDDIEIQEAVAALLSQAPVMPPPVLYQKQQQCDSMLLGTQTRGGTPASYVPEAQLQRRQQHYTLPARQAAANNSVGGRASLGLSQPLPTRRWQITENTHSTVGESSTGPFATRPVQQVQLQQGLFRGVDCAERYAVQPMQPQQGAVLAQQQSAASRDSAVQRMLALQAKMQQMTAQLQQLSSVVAASTSTQRGHTTCALPVQHNLAAQVWDAGQGAASMVESTMPWLQ